MSIEPVLTALVDDPAWVRAKYEEAKKLLKELSVDPESALASDLHERVDDFVCATYMDRCTTLGPDCGCNL